MIRHWSHARQKGWGYPPKKTDCQSGLRFQRYEPLKSVTTAGRPAGRPLILRFLVFISRNSLRASRSLVIIYTQYINHVHGCEYTGASPTGGGGGRDPPLLKTAGLDPPPPQKFGQFSIFLLKSITFFCIFKHFQNKVAQIRGEIKFWG